MSAVACGAAVASINLEVTMEPIVERCCGLDVAQASVAACLLAGPAHRKPEKETRLFGTFTRDLFELRDWLRARGCTHVGMESTGVYWMPVYEVLEGHFQLVVGNAQHIKNVPGRKTDVNDSEWLADLLRHGLIRPSFVPPKPIRELRVLTRYRRKVVEARTSERNRVTKVLEQGGIKLATVASDVFGVSGTEMVLALVEGKSTVAEIANLAKKRLRAKIPELLPALNGQLTETHREVLREQMERLQRIDESIARVDQLIQAKLEPYRTQHALLVTIPGVEAVLAAVLIAEMGVDMSVFPDAAHAAAWAGVCPGNNETGGKRRPARSRKGNVPLRTALVEAAQAAAHKKEGYLRDKFYRLKARRGYKRAAMAVAHKILVAAYHVLKTGQPYRDLGDGYLDRLDEAHVTKNLVRRLERLGYQVKLERKAA